MEHRRSRHSRRAGLACAAFVIFAFLMFVRVPGVDAGSSITGRAVGPEGEPLEGVRVYLDVRSQAGTDQRSRNDGTRTDSSGCFRLGAMHAHSVPRSASPFIAAIGRRCTSRRRLEERSVRTWCWRQWTVEAAAHCIGGGERTLPWSLAA